MAGPRAYCALLLLSMQLPAPDTGCVRKDAAPRPRPEEGRAMSPEHTLVGAGVSELPRERGKSYLRTAQAFPVPSVLLERKD